MRFEYSVPLIGIGSTYLQKLVETSPYFPIYIPSALHQTTLTLPLNNKKGVLYYLCNVVCGLLGLQPLGSTWHKAE